MYLKIDLNCLQHFNPFYVEISNEFNVKLLTFRTLNARKYLDSLFFSNFLSLEILYIKHLVFVLLNRMELLNG